jgi:hypothetical protein
VRITAEPRSDQWNADDFVGGPREFTIAGVKVGTAEQKYDIELVEGEGRVWRPPLTVLRLLIAAWGDDAAVWVGRRVRLYRDEKIRFGSDAVGGIRVAALSDLPGGKTLKVALTASRGKRALHTVEPLTAAPTVNRQSPTPQPDVAAMTDLDALRGMWQAADTNTRKAIEARVAELTTEPTGGAA